MEVTNLVGTILFGISGGLLSLVGLIAIYISINTQHSINRAKEVIWEIKHMDANNDNLNENEIKSLRWSLKHYCELLRAGVPTIMVISLAIITIISVATAWFAYYLYYVKPQIKELVWFPKSLFMGGVSILGLFIIILILLIFVALISSLPSPKKLFDMRSDVRDVPSGSLIAKSVGLKIYKNNIIFLPIIEELVLPSEIKLELQISFSDERDDYVENFSLTQENFIASPIQLKFTEFGYKTLHAKLIYKLEDERYISAIYHGDIHLPIKPLYPISISNFKKVIDPSYIKGYRFDTV